MNWDEGSWISLPSHARAGWRDDSCHDLYFSESFTPIIPPSLGHILSAPHPLIPIGVLPHPFDTHQIDSVINPHHRYLWNDPSNGPSRPSHGSFIIHPQSPPFFTYLRTVIPCEGYTTPYNESPFPGGLLATMSTTTNRDTLQYESMGVRHDRT